MGQEEHGWAIAGEFPAMQLWYHFSRKAFETFVLPSVTILTQCCWFELFTLWVEMPRQLNTRHTLESISFNMGCRPEKFTSISNSAKLCTEAKVHLAQEGVVCHTPGEAYAQLSPRTKLEKWVYFSAGYNGEGDVSYGRLFNCSLGVSFPIRQQSGRQGKDERCRCGWEHFCQSSLFSTFGEKNRRNMD